MACATLSLKRSHEFDPLSPRRPKRRRCTPMTISPAHSPPAKPASVFREATPSFSKEQLADSIRCEIKKLQHRKQLAHSSPSQSDSETDQPSTSQNCGTAQRKDTAPLFTFSQMTTLCERMIKDRTDQLCEEYDKVLANKLAEQYEAFLKFNHDQIQQQFSRSSDASYLS